MTRKLIYSGSVKDLYAEHDELIFVYSDRYSVFDWGHMPDEIPHKGEALASLAVSFFEFLRQHGIASHYQRQGSAREVVVQPVAVVRPPWADGRYDYSAYAAHPLHTLVPLEVIFRYALAQGNSLQGRLQQDPDYLRDLGLRELPGADARFDPPLVEFSTKLESTDRYLRRQQIGQYHIFSTAELAAACGQVQRIAAELRQLFDGLGIRLWDGKVEFAYGAGTYPERQLQLVDSIGPDELRLTFGGLPLSKEFLRQIYTDTAWAHGLRQAKALAKERGSRDWKRICTDELGLAPRHLTPAELAVASLLYQALANEVARAVGRLMPFDAAITLAAWRERAGQLSPLA